MLGNFRDWPIRDSFRKPLQAAIWCYPNPSSVRRFAIEPDLPWLETNRPNVERRDIVIAEERASESVFPLPLLRYPLNFPCDGLLDIVQDECRILVDVSFVIDLDQRWTEGSANHFPEVLAGKT